MRLRQSMVIAGLLAMSATVLAQGPIELPVSEMHVPYELSSGLMVNSGQAPSAVSTHTVTIPGAPSLRLVFDETMLGPGDVLIVSSPITNDVHQLDSAELQKWSDTSAYFNGDTLLVTLVLSAGSSGSFSIHEVITGVLPPPSDTVCGSDDRVATVDNRTLRLLPIGCTVWLVSPTSCALTAGHCTVSASTVAEANVPPSTGTGVLVHPPVQFQFPVTSIAGISGGLGNDWRVCTLANNNLGQSPAGLFGWYTVASTLPSGGATIRVTGYGVDSSPSSANQTCQTSVGPYTTTSGTTLRYAVDTEGGNSGSPIVIEATGVAVGIHTNGGCTASGGQNSGTSLSNAGFQAAFTPNCPQAPVFALDLSTTGGGAGNFHLAINNIPTAAVEGFTLFSMTTPGAAGQGSAFGLYPDALTFMCLTSPASPTGPFRWIKPFVPGVYPAAPFNLPPGSIPLPVGAKVDGCAVGWSAGFATIYMTSVVRITF